MERLTKHTKEFGYNLKGNITVRGDCKTYNMAIEKLAQYEDTGLTPEEIKEQIEILEHNYKCMEDTLERQCDNALKVVNKLEKEHDYWKKEALKWASELGEQKIERGKNGIEKCIMCGEIIPEGNQACWKCKAVLDRCSVCRNRDKNICLLCKDWRYKSYETKKVH